MGSIRLLSAVYVPTPLLLNVVCTGSSSVCTTNSFLLSICSPPYRIAFYSLVEPVGAWHNPLQLKTTCLSLLGYNTVWPGAPKSGLVLPGGTIDKARGCTML